MARLLDLPPEVLFEIPWNGRDLWSLVLTSRSFNLWFTPKLYQKFEMDFEGFEMLQSEKSRIIKSLGFLRTMRTSATLASCVQAVKLNLSTGGVQRWNYGGFQRAASRFQVAPEFGIVAVATNSSNQGTLVEDKIENLENEGEDTEVEGEALSDREEYFADAQRGYYDSDLFLYDFGRSLLSKLPALQRLDICYSNDVRLFEHAPSFAHLLEVKIRSRRTFENAGGDLQFDDALQLLGLPKLKKLSLECDIVRESSIRCIPAKSSSVEEIEIGCPNIPAEDFDYLMSIPRRLKALRWKRMARVCSQDIRNIMMDDGLVDFDVSDDDDDDDDDDDKDDRLVDFDVSDDDDDDDDDDDESLNASMLGCKTISLAEIVSSLWPFRSCLEELAIEYAYVGTCGHADSRPADLSNFEHLTTLEISPQVLRGFKRCSCRDPCLEECKSSQQSSTMTTGLPPAIQQISFRMQTDGSDVVDLISQLIHSYSSSLRKVVLLSPLHQSELPGLTLRRRTPKLLTLKEFHELQSSCSLAGLDLVSCFHERCFSDIAREKSGIHSQYPPDDVVISD